MGGKAKKAMQRCKEKLAAKTLATATFTATSTGAATKDDEPEEEELELATEAATLFRSVAVRTNYASQDRPDMAYAVREVCRHMSCSTAGAMRALKRIGRYLLSHARHP